MINKFASIWWGFDHFAQEKGKLCNDDAWTNKHLPEVEVLHVDILVRGGLALAPEQQALLGSHLLDRDVLDGKAKNDGPDHAQGHLDVTINDLCNDKNFKYGLGLLGHDFPKFLPLYGALKFFASFRSTKFFFLFTWHEIF